MSNKNGLIACSVALFLILGMAAAVNLWMLIFALCVMLCSGSFTWFLIQHKQQE